MDTIALQRVPRRTKRLLENMLATRQISKSGLEWLVAATDPFHDTEMVVSGYPDIRSSKSLVQVVTRTANITLATGKDVHIFLAPFTNAYASTLGTKTLTQWYMRNNGFSSASPSGTALIYPGLNAITAPTGEDWTTSTTAVNTGAVGGINLLGLPDDFGAGELRFISCGWEVVNTTPVVSMAGSITAYRCPSLKQASFISSALTIATLTYALLRPTEFCSLPPGTQTDAALFSNSRTWAASEGAYQVAALHDITNPYTMPLPGLVGMAEVPNSAILSGDTDRVVYLPAGSFDPTSTASLANCSHVIPWDVSGLVIRGDPMYPQTYQITVKYYVERVPTSSDPNLLVLATEAPPHDPCALEIYSRAMSHLPVAVPVGQNPLGEWFDTVMNVVATALPAIGTALSPIFAPAALIGSSLGGIARTIGADNRLKREQAEDNSRKNLKPMTTSVLQSNGTQQTGGYKRKGHPAQSSRKLPPLQSKRQ